MSAGKSKRRLSSGSNFYRTTMDAAAALLRAVEPQEAPAKGADTLTNEVGHGMGIQQMLRAQTTDSRVTSEEYPTLVFQLP